MVCAFKSAVLSILSAPQILERSRAVLDSVASDEDMDEVYRDTKSVPPMVTAIFRLCSFLKANSLTRRNPTYVERVALWP
eukprot:4077743-Amphidinium_carterae.1